MEQWQPMRATNQAIRATAAVPDPLQCRKTALRDFMERVDETQERCEEINLGQLQDSQGRVVGAPAMLTPYVRRFVERTFREARELLGSSSPWNGSDERAGGTQVQLLLGRPVCRVRAVLRHLEALQGAVTEARAALLIESPSGAASEDARQLVVRVS
jgi:hypothetical protein